MGQVRNGTFYETRRFLDSHTEEVTILAIFHSTGTGLTTEVLVNGHVMGNVVSVELETRHLDFLPKSSKNQLILDYVVLFFFILLAYVINIVFYFGLRRFAKWNGTNHIHSGKGEIVYDILQANVVNLFNIYKLVRDLGSEDRVVSVVKDVSSVGFARSDILFTEKVDQYFKALEKYHEEFAGQTLMGVLVFIVMVLMLLRMFIATAVHPRTRLLVGTFQNAFSDLVSDHPFPADAAIPL